MSALYLDPELANATNGDELLLTGAEARHAGTVARLARGETIIVGNGRGLIIRGTLLSVERDTLHYRADEITRQPQSNPEIVLVQSLAKGGRDELAIQTATELGVSAVIPWQSERSIVRWNAEKQQKNMHRWQSIVQEAAKQSLNAWVPEVLAMHNTQQLVKAAPDALKIVLEPRATERLTTQLPALRAQYSQSAIYLFVGPEGGLTSREHEQLIESGAHLLKMGDLVLRSSTAGPAAITVINALFERW